jgi:glycogen debranching enzyme
MPEPWSLQDRPAAVGAAGDRITIVEGSAFLVCAAGGDVAPERAEGFFFRDCRFLSRWELLVNGRAPEALASSVPDPYRATLVSRVAPRGGRADATLLVLRHRYVGRGMREDLVVRNLADEPAYCAVEMSFGSDFATVAEVRGAPLASPGPADVATADGGRTMVFHHRHGAHRRALRISLSEPAGYGAMASSLPAVDANLVRVEVIVPARGEWSCCQQFVCVIDDVVVDPRWPAGQAVTRSTPAERLAAWRRSVPVIETDHDGLRRVVASSAEDLGSLRIFDPEHPERTVVAAGAPWSMTLFGRDSLLSAWMALLADPELALGTLQTLARLQGRDVRPATEEQPGRILHELRFGEGAPLTLGGGPISYGTADATPLFVMLLGELRRWGLAREAVDELLPHADAAIAWITDWGDADGDGYVEYQRASDRGLRNQGWKDSDDAVRFADGRLAEGPVALAEVQGYVYAAYLARAFFAAEAGDAELSGRLRERAKQLKTAFNRDFWIDGRGWLAMGLDRDKRPIDALASNMGHCLWTGILDADKADAVARRLMSPDMFSGWGVRTLATSMAGYNPIGYHVGSVWPHDNAIVAAGLMRYGFVREAQRVIMAMIDAAVARGGRLPELFSGLERLELPMVVGYPGSCSPQAWAAASPLLMLRTLLRFDPWVPRGKVWLHPELPEQIGHLHVGRIPLAGARVSVTVEGDKVSVDGLPDELELVDAPRHPLTGS